MQILALFALIEQLRGYHLNDFELLFLLLLAVEELPQANLIIPNYFVVELNRRALELGSRLQKPVYRVHLASVRIHYAGGLAQDRRPEMIRLALKHFQQAADELANLYKEDIPTAGIFYGPCLNDFARTLKEKTFGDRRSDLEEAIELFDRCLAIPEHHEFLGTAAMSAKLRCDAANELFQLLGNEAENIELLEQSLQIADKELKALDSSSEAERRAATYDVHFTRESLWLSSALARSLVLEAKLALKEDDKIKELLTAHCRQVLARQEEVLATLGPTNQEIFSTFSTHLSAD